MIEQDYPGAVQATQMILFYLLGGVAILYAIEGFFRWVKRPVKRLGG